MHIGGFALHIALFPSKPQAADAYQRTRDGGDRFRQGHRIRLDISTSNFPGFDVNPNTGAPEASPGPRAVARNSVHTGGGRASRLVLPWVKSP
ncbi:hypothetical protein J8G26_04690 [Acidovorax sp. JG5]|nr:hypothetical protein [Acidovorax sp. JG5]